MRYFAVKYLFTPAHEVLVLIAYAQNLHLNAHTDDEFSLASGLNFGLKSSVTHLLYVWKAASNEGSGESAHMRRLA